MGGRRVSSLLLGLLCLLSGALLPGEAQEETSRLPADSQVATTSPLLVSSADLPDFNLSSSVAGRLDATSEAPGNETVTETVRPSPTVSAAESDDASSNVTTAFVNVTKASDEMASNPGRISPVTGNNDTTSADVTEPPPPTQPPSAVNIVTADAATETPSLLATLRTTAKMQLNDDFTPHTTTSMSLLSTWMSAITTSLSNTTTMSSPKPSSPATQSSTAVPRTTRPEVQRGPSVLEVGDEKDLTSYHSTNSSNPMFVMIVSVFTIMVVMVVVVVGFHRYKKRNSRTEFRRLQDLPMDDMMEDTPLSLYSY